MRSFKKRILFSASLFVLVQQCFGQVSKIYHIIMYGQSLMLGTQSVPLISDYQRYNSLMFKGGLRAGYDADSNFYQSLVPLIEKTSVSPYSKVTLGETPASGFSEYFLDLLQKENKFTYDNSACRFNGWNNRLLISIPAQGSTSAGALTQDGEYWTRLKHDIIAGNRLAKAKGRAHVIPFIIWNQGERDIDLRTPPETYKNILIRFQSRADSLIKSVTKQRETVKLILYQTSSHNVRKAGENPVIANAQYELAKSQPHITMSNATYQLEYVKDNVHLTNVGSKLNGVNHAIAAKRILIDNQNWRPISVESIAYKDNSMVLTFRVPVAPLVLDTCAVQNPGNYGFRIFKSSGEEVTIKTLRLTSANQITIGVNIPLSKGDYLWYGNNGITTGAINGARGNLRDSQGETMYWHFAGTKVVLNNWCPILKEVL